MDLVDVSYQGPVIDDPQILDRLPHDYRSVLEQINGFTQFGGGLAYPRRLHCSDMAFARRRLDRQVCLVRSLSGDYRR